jgi:hypothetical protein
MAKLFGHDRVLGWALGTFHTALFVLAIVFALYQTGRLGDALSNLSTPLGLVIYAFLWTITCWSTGRATEGLDWSRFQAGDAAGGGVLWGGVTAVVFVVGGAELLAVSAALAHLRGGTLEALDAILVLVGLVFGGLIAQRWQHGRWIKLAALGGLGIGGLIVLPYAMLTFVIGAFVGAVFELLDTGALLICRFLKD